MLVTLVDQLFEQIFWRRICQFTYTIQTFPFAFSSADIPNLDNNQAKENENSFRWMKKIFKKSKILLSDECISFHFLDFKYRRENDLFLFRCFFCIYFMAILFHSDLANCCTLRYWLLKWILQIQLMHYNFKYFLIKINKQNTHKIDLTVIRSCKKFL